MNQRSADLAGGSRHNHLQPNLLKPTGIALPREKELICYRYRTVRYLGKTGREKGSGEIWNVPARRSTVMSVNTFLLAI